MEDACKHTDWDLRKGKPYVISCSEKLEKDRKRQNTQRNNSYSWRFYGPQGRILRLNIQDET
jgi:uridine phosphorylase